MSSQQAVVIHSPTIEAAGAVADRFPLTMRHTSLGENIVGIGNVTYQGESILECDDIGRHYYVHVPVVGRMQSFHRGEYLTVCRGVAAVHGPGEGAFRGRWAAGTRSLCVTLDRPSVDAAFTRLVGHQAGSGLGLETALPTGQGAPRTWLDLVATLGRQADGPSGLLSHPLVAEPLIEGVLNGFLLATRHAYSETLSEPVRALRPAPVRAAVDLMHGAPREPWTVGRVAQECGVSVRTLQSAFRQYLSTTPMAYLREVRLRHAHEDLRSADPHTESVAEIARRWGFGNLGRFAAAHEEKYGQTPSHTLRRLR